MGVVSPLGNDVATFWEGLRTGRNGVRHLDWLVKEGYRSTVAGPVDEEVNLEPWFADREVRRMDPYCRYALYAAAQAIEQAQLEDQVDPQRVGILVGSGIGGLHVFADQMRTLLEKGHRRVSPFFIPMLIPDIAAGFIGIRWGFQGPNYSISSACATASHAIGTALHIIRYGAAEVMICGAADAVMSPIAFAGFSNMKALTPNPDPETACRPFDARRDGFVMGEGAGIVVLEALEHAQARGATILAELVGFGQSADAYHLTSPHPEGQGAALAMRNALADAGIKPEQVDYINAHGTSTPANDPTETKAIKQVFGQHAYKLAVSSTKSMTGHLLGASGGVELVAVVQALREGLIPPTIHLEEPDPACDLDYVPRVARKANLTYAISNSFGFGGHNAVLAVKRWED